MKDQSKIDGWVFDGYLGPTQMPAGTKFDRNFKSGCLGPGCFVCGSMVFDPDGTFHESFDCETEPNQGRWRIEGGRLVTCIGKNCTFKAKYYQFRRNQYDQIVLTKNGVDSVYDRELIYWEPHPWQDE